MRKIALCFLTYDNLSKPTLWKSLLEKTDNKFNVYLHNKFTFQDNDTNFDKYCIDTIVPTKWGNISLIRATLKLFEAAFQNKENEYFVLLSDKCIPLYDLNTIYHKIVSIDKNIISNSSSNNRRFSTFQDKDFFEESKFVKQGQFMILKRDSVKWFILNDYTHVFGEHFEAPDEHYFVNLCEKFNISYLNKAVTYVNWDEGDKGHPKEYFTLTEEDIKEIKNNSGYHNHVLFIRKINKDCKLPNYYNTITGKN